MADTQDGANPQEILDQVIAARAPEREELEAEYQKLVNTPGKLDPLNGATTTYSQTYSYPKGSDRIYPHYIKFNINLPEKSQYFKQVQVQGADSTVDQNRTKFERLGAVEGVLNTAATAVITGTAVGATAAAEAVARAAKRGKTIKGDTFKAAAAAGITAAGVSTTIAAIDVTRKTKRLAASIRLYMPDQVVMQTQNKYGEVSMTAALGLAGLALNSGGSLGNAASNTLEKFVSFLTNQAQTQRSRQATGLEANAAETFGNIAGAGGKKLGIFGEGIENVLLQSFGYAQNPQVEVLFETTDLRQFEYAFNFLPRNADEAREVLNIIKVLRFYSAPELAQGTRGRYFIPPAEFDIQYMFIDNSGKEVENTKLHKISTCALVGVDINYVGDSGQFVTFPDGTPVNIQMRLSFKELEVIHKGLVNQGY